MKVINLKSQNVIICDCGNVFEFGYSDYEAQLEPASDGFFKVGVRCPICGKLHIQEPDNYDDSISRENRLKYRSPMNDCSFEDIATRCQHYYDTGDLPFNVGDSKKITLKNGEETGFVFIGQDDFYAQKTGQRAPLSFMFECLLQKNRRMNASDTNRGGWRASAMRIWLNEDFVALIPDELLAIVKTTKKWTINSGESPTMTEDKFYLLSEVEVFGTHQYSHDGEGTQYEFFKDWRNRLRSYHNTASGVYWWLRSPYYNYSYDFCMVDNSGSVSYGSASNYYGVSPAFTL